MTADQFMNLPEDPEGRKLELRNGEVIALSQPGEEHGEVAGNVYEALWAFARDRRLGMVRFDTGFRIRTDPDRVVNPDVAFVAAGMLPAGRDRRKAIPAAPTLAVEVVSPNDRDHEVGAKVIEYLASGTRRVWVVRPESRTVTVYRADGTAAILAVESTLTSDDAAFKAPGFELAVASVFEES